MGELLLKRWLVGFVVAVTLVDSAWAQTARKQAAPEHWVSTWATALQLMPPAPRRPPPAAGATAAPVAPGATAPAAPAASSPASSGPAPTGPAPTGQPPIGPPPHNMPATFTDQTLRMVVRTSIGGRRVRVTLSNMLNAEPVTVGAAHLGLHAGHGAIMPNSGRPLTFSGESSFVVPPGVLVLSDPVDLDVAPLTDLAVSLFLPGPTGPPSSHTIGTRTSYVAQGNVAAQASLPADTATTTAYAWLSSVDVVAPVDAFSVVTFGDSITDGYATTTDANRAWPALLAQRLSSDKRLRHVAVVNQGISGNQVLRNGAGLSMLARFDRDVLSRAGVKWIVLLGGINDINIRGRFGNEPLTAEQLIDGYEQIIARSHAHGIRVVGATVTPQEGQRTATAQGEEIRQAVNRWIRASGRFDAVVDFDAAVRDSAQPARIRAEYDPGDHIHPNDAGNQAMAAAFDLSVFAK
jgi:lysophospholipase L1-like esterase